MVLDLKKLPPFHRVPFFMLLGIALVVGLIAIKSTTSLIYKEKTKNFPSSEALILPAYEAKIEKETDARKLAKVGSGLLGKNLYAYAAINFKRASEIDPNYRDAAYGWAYALIEQKHDSLSIADRQEIKTAIARAEAVDPLYLPLLKLKLLLAQTENDQSVVQATQQRLDLLAKKDSPTTP